MYRYFSEFKTRFILLFITWFSNILVGYFYKEILLFLFLEPDLFNSFYMNFPCYFIFTDVFELFSIYIQLILFISFQIFILYFLYHFFVFLRPGLFLFEYYYFNYILKLLTFIWFLSVFSSKYILIPLTWNFFLSFQNLSSVILYFEAKLNEYLTFYISVYYLCIFYCQTFTFLIFFFTFTNKNLLTIKRCRKVYYYFFVLFSTLVSPPEIISQLLISFVLIVLYEFFVFIFILQSSVNFLVKQPIKTYKNPSSK
jgi:sec-independent protein translocase protein TatC